MGEGGFAAGGSLPFGLGGKLLLRPVCVELGLLQRDPKHWKISRRTGVVGFEDGVPATLLVDLFAVTLVAPA